MGSASRAADERRGKERRGVKEQARGIQECEIFISRVKLTHTPPHSFYQGA